MNPEMKNVKHGVRLVELSRPDRASTSVVPHLNVVECALSRSEVLLLEPYLSSGTRVERHASRRDTLRGVKPADKGRDLRAN